METFCLSGSLLIRITTALGKAQRDSSLPEYKWSSDAKIGQAIISLAAVWFGAAL